MTIFFFILISLFLLFEGRTALRMIVRPGQDSLILWALSFPVGALLNAFLFFLLHIFHISFSALSVFGGHLILLILLFIGGRFIPLNANSFPSLASPMKWTTGKKALFALCSVLLLLIILSTISAVLSFPMLYWDSFTNWAMRAKIALHEGAFPLTGVMMPQYPILLHSLQIVYALPSGFSDQTVNAGTFLLTISLFSSIYLLLCKQLDRLGALITLSLLLGMPLVLIHLRQGYADIHVTGYILLSAVLLDRALSTREPYALLLSALFIAAAAWTKFEGIYFGILPWLAILGIDLLRQKSWKWSLLFGALATILLTLPWPLYLLAINMPLSPHSRGFEYHLDALPHVFEQLFTLGTFGFHLWGIAALLILFFLLEWRRIHLFVLDRPSLSFGLLSTFLVLGVFLFTAEVDGLLHRHNFSRAMLTPVLLLTLALSTEAYRRFYSAQPSFSRKVS